ncbi:Hypothetical protein NTJ_02227 [Nesidiocoris tenuis]|uniref:Secreted protein n=1 Tax=Nesidiocoris tenuis TaxID=355587 RepID=A0ABN7AAX6_9HEMI|nr:Hypothetical protein NTJ_02227 [Nesidiocoris tenuis]
MGRKTGFRHYRPFCWGCAASSWTEVFRLRSFSSVHHYACRAVGSSPTPRLRNRSIIRHLLAVCVRPSRPCGLSLVRIRTLAQSSFILVSHRQRTSSFGAIRSDALFSAHTMAHFECSKETQKLSQLTAPENLTSCRSTG